MSGTHYWDYRHEDHQADVQRRMARSWAEFVRRCRERKLALGALRRNAWWKRDIIEAFIGQKYLHDDMCDWWPP